MNLIKNEKVKAFTNLIVMFVLTLNAGLTFAGKSPLPIDENTIVEVVSYAAGFVSMLWAWWKNNNVTKAAIEGQEVIKVLKTKFTDDGEQEA